MAYPYPPGKAVTEMNRIFSSLGKEDFILLILSKNVFFKGCGWPLLS